MKISRFEEIQAWQAARELCKGVYNVSGNGSFFKDLGLRDQVRRAAISVMANIAEGFDSHSNPEFVQFLYYSLRSASELQSHLYVALDQGYVTQAGFMTLCEQAGKVKSMVFGLAQYLRTHKKQTDVPSLRHKPRASNLELRTSNVEPL